MLVLKFISWPQPDNQSVEKVVTCDSYEVVAYPDRSQAVNTFRGNPSEVPTEVIMLGPKGAGVTAPHYRRLFVMNDQGKTIDSYSAER